MADNVAITPGSGAIAAADDIGGVLFQRVKVAIGADGVNDGDVSASNPLPVAGYGELIEAIEALRMAMHSLTRSGMALVMPDSAGRIPVLATSASGFSVTGTVTSNIGTGALAGLTQIGGIAAVDHIPALLHLQADNLRRNIVVT
jgi:hypothetical protein